MTKSNGRRVLLVDDAALVRRFFRQALEPAGFEIDEAVNGIEALEKLLTNAFDLLIVDINMPNMDGLTFVKELRAQAGAGANVPVLMASTENKQQDKDAALAAGANFYLTKPVQPDELTLYAKMLTGAP